MRIFFASFCILSILLIFANLRTFVIELESLEFFRQSTDPLFLRALTHKITNQFALVLAVLFEFMQRFSLL